MGLTGAGLAIVFGMYWGVRQVFFTDSPGEELAQQAAAPDIPVVDSDTDGLPDIYEQMYRTDPAKGDTDGDGVSDLDELRTGTDPTIPGPADSVKPATGGQVAGAQTFTQQYLATLPEDVAREDILVKERLEAFIATKRGELLPTLPAGTVQQTSDAGADAIRVYLDTISASHNKQLHSVTNESLEAAFNDQLQLNPVPLNTIVTQLEQNIKVLKTIPAPTEVADMHEKLIRATQALYDNALRLRDMNQDFVGALVATKNIDDIGAIFQEISTSVTELEAKYGLQ